MSVSDLESRFGLKPAQLKNFVHRRLRDSLVRAVAHGESRKIARDDGADERD
jgi:hypothetical protein